MKIGVLALQGAFARHAQVLMALGAAPVEVRCPSDLTDVDAMVLPGGESTTMSMLLDSSGLRHPVADRLVNGLSPWGLALTRCVCFFRSHFANSIQLLVLRDRYALFTSLFRMRNSHPRILEYVFK